MEAPKFEYYHRAGDEEVVPGQKIGFGDGTIGVVLEVYPDHYAVIKVSAADVLAVQPFAVEIREVNEQLRNDRGEAIL